MKVSWDWLKQYVDLPWSAEELAQRLMMAGCNHEGTDDVEGDIVIDLEITSNRPDCLGHLGIAREVAALGRLDLRLPSTTFTEGPTPVGSLTSLTVASAATWCPEYRARVVQNVKVGPSPTWMQRRLRAIGLTPVNNVVDITNYVLMEVGHPLHAFDLDRLAGRQVIVRDAKPKEKFQAINHKEYELEPWMGVIADADRAVAIAGVMGGADTEITTATTNVFLESARFTPISIRRTSRALDLHSDSSHRFERKLDPAAAVWASDRATHLLQELAGGTVTAGHLHHGPTQHSRAAITLRQRRVEQILGIRLPMDEIIDSLRRLDFAITKQTATEVVVAAPTHRQDATREIDLVEEVGRIHGYDDVPADRTIPLAVSRQRKVDRVTARAREMLAAVGALEAITFTFVDAKTQQLVRPWTAVEPLVVHHSSRKQENQLRQSLLPSLLKAVGLNESRGNVDVSLYELTSVVWPKTGALPDEPTLLGIVSHRDWRTVRGWIDTLFRRWGLCPTFTPAEFTGLQAVQAGKFELGKQVVGVVGNVDRRVEQALDLRRPVVAAELWLEPIVAQAELTPTAAPLPAFPPIERDLAVVLDDAVAWTRLEQTARSHAGPLLESLSFVDLYRGKPVPTGKKSLAFRLVYRHPERTLTREEVDDRQQVVIDAIAQQLGGVLR